MTRVLFANSATAVLWSIVTAVEQAEEWIMPESWTCSTIQWESDSVCVIGHWLHLFPYSPLVCAIRHRCANDHSLFSFDSVALHRCSRSACFPPSEAGLATGWLWANATLIDRPENIRIATVWQNRQYLDSFISRDLGRTMGAVSIHRRNSDEKLRRRW